MNNEEKILALLEKQGEQLAALTGKVDKIDGRLEQVEETQKKQGETLEKQGEQLTALKTTQDKQGEALAELYNAVNRVASAHEHTIIPRLDTLHEGQQLLRETLAHKDSMEELKDAMTEWEVVNRAALSEMWKHIAKLEKTK